MRVALTFAFMLLAASVSKNAQADVLAIAYCQENRAVGVSVKPKESEAAEFAIKNCLVGGGSVGCCHLQIVLTKAECGAIAANDYGFGLGKADTQQEAIQVAKESCGDSDCRVIASRCR